MHRTNILRKEQKMSDFSVKSKATYDKMADEYYNSFDGKFTRKFKRLLAENISAEDNINILDVACGNGSLLALLSKQKTISDLVLTFLTE